MDLRIFYLKSRDIYIVEGLNVSRWRRAFPAISAFAWTSRLFPVPGQKKPPPPPRIFGTTSGATSLMGGPDFCPDFSLEKADGRLFLAPGRL
jgi:hypothetical protein